MRHLLPLLLAFVVATSALFLSGGGVAYASFHCMRIHAVMGGFSGNNNIQYVELRMDDATFPQNLVATRTLQFLDASNVVQATFTFPSNVANAALGESILIATSEFNSYVTGGAADFVFSGANTASSTAADVLHPIQRPNGKVVWALGIGGCTGLIPADSVAYGVGPTPNYGTVAPALPSDNRALRLSNLSTTPTNNSAEYSPLQAVSTSTFPVGVGSLATDFRTPRNNGRTVLGLAVSVGGIAEQPDASSADTAAASVGGDDARGGVVYGIGAGILAAATTCGAGWYVYRRRVAAGA